MIVLGIETSCDETAAAVVAGSSEILSNVVYSQIAIHKQFGGVVPELASRKHIETISIVIRQALEEANISAEQIEGIGVTRGPGLIGSLLVGIAAAKGMSLALNIPICGVNHLHGHLSAIRLERNDISFPLVALAVSGGHTSIYLIKNWMDITILGKTRDDAAGEAFDKVAKLLGLGYPGGVVIEELAAKSDPNRVKLPRPLMDSDSLDFSFSGLKTAVLRYVQEITAGTLNNRPGSYYPLVSSIDQEIYRDSIGEIAAAFQEAVTDVLATKAVYAARKEHSKQIMICGGVAANKKLREKVAILASKSDIEPLFPSFNLCTDNAGMIAARAQYLLSHGIKDDLDFDAKSRW